MSADEFAQRDPGPVAIQQGIDRLVAGLNARDPDRHWRVVALPASMRVDRHNDADDGLEAGDGTGGLPCRGDPG